MCAATICCSTCCSRRSSPARRTASSTLSMLTGRTPPADAARWNTATLKAIVAYVNGKPVETSEAVQALRRRLDGTIQGFGVPLSRADVDTIDRFHREFIDAGLGLQFHSFNRAPQQYYPTLRDLLCHRRERPCVELPRVRGGLPVSADARRARRSHSGRRRRRRSARDACDRRVDRRARRTCIGVLYFERRELSVSGWHLPALRGQIWAVFRTVRARLSSGRCSQAGARACPEFSRSIS